LEFLAFPKRHDQRHALTSFAHPHPGPGQVTQVGDHTLADLPNRLTRREFGYPPAHFALLAGLRRSSKRDTPRATHHTSIVSLMEMLGVGVDIAFFVDSILIGYSLLDCHFLLTTRLSPCSFASWHTNSRQVSKARRPACVELDVE
jgi:hypothetical protein